MGQARQWVERIFDHVNAKDADSLRQMHAEDCELTLPGVGTVKGPDQVVGVWQSFFTAFPDGHIVAHTWVEQPDRAVNEHTFTGTHQGPLTGPQGEIPATGRKATIDGCVVYTFENEKVKSVHLYYDQMDMLGQLGVVPGSTER